MKKQVLLTLAAVSVSAASFAQGFVTTGSTKKVLIEESTGAWCQYCPDGAVYLQDILDGNPDAIGVSIHGGGSSANSDKMKFPDGDAVTSTYFTAFPLGMVDRTPAGSPAKIGLNRGSWSSAVTGRMAAAPEFEVSLLHGMKASTGEVTAIVRVKALKAGSGNYNVNVYVIEDSVKGTGAGYDQVNYYDTQSGHAYYGKGNPIKGFNHMHVVRAMLGGPFGTTGVVKANPPVNSVASKTYTYTLPTGANYKRFKLVAMVQKDNADPEKRAIMNAVEAKMINGKLDVSQVSALEGMEVFPNPASGDIRIRGTFQNASDLQLTLTNTVGQAVFTRLVKNNGSRACDETINVSGLANGTYFLSVRGEGGQNTERIVINH